MQAGHLHEEPPREFGCTAVSRLRSPVDHAGGGGFLEVDFREERQNGFEEVPQINRQVLGGGDLKAREVVEVMVIQSLEQGRHGGLDVFVGDHHARLRRHGSLASHFKMEGVSVDAAALVPFAEHGEAMRGVEGESFVNDHSHPIVPPVGRGSSLLGRAFAARTTSKKEDSPGVFDSIHLGADCEFSSDTRLQSVATRNRRHP